MVIDNNEIQRRAMEASRAGDTETGKALQGEFVASLHAFREAGGDHCSCAKPCDLHGNCVDCVAVHRAQRDHLPNCFHSMVNEKLESVSQLTEHSLRELAAQANR